MYYGRRFNQDARAVGYLTDHWAVLSKILLKNEPVGDVDDEKVFADKTLNDIKNLYFDMNKIPRPKDALDMIDDLYGFGSHHFLMDLFKMGSAQPLFAYSFNYLGTWRLGDLSRLTMRKIHMTLALRRIGVKVNPLSRYNPDLV